MKGNFKKNMKKYFSIFVLISALIFSIFKTAGCNGSVQTPTPSPPIIKVPIPTEVLSSDTIEGTLKKTWANYTDSSWHGYMLDTIEIFQEGTLDSIWADDTLTVAIEWVRNMRTGDEYQRQNILNHHKSAKHVQWDSSHGL